MPSPQHCALAREFSSGAREAAAREALAQAQRSNPDPAPSLDFDSRRRARETATAAERAKQQCAGLADTRAVHAPLSHAQAQAAREHQQTVTAQKRLTERIELPLLREQEPKTTEVVSEHVPLNDIAQSRPKHCATTS